MDALYLFRHSANDDFELRQSLRSLEQHAPYIRKVWIYGDRPGFLSEDVSLIEHVPHETTSRISGVKNPLTNFFLLNFYASLISDLSPEYLRFSDDFYLLQPFPLEEARRVRYQQDLSRLTSRGRGLWKDSLWRTYDLLTRLGYTGYNFETHTPTYLKRRWVMAAYCDFKDFVTEDRHYGMLGLTAILNHAHRQEALSLVDLREENSRCGFWGQMPSAAEIAAQSVGKAFFNFDDAAFGESIKSFLAARFSTPCRYEKV